MLTECSIFYIDFGLAEGNGGMKRRRKKKTTTDPFDNKIKGKYYLNFFDTAASYTYSANMNIYLLSLQVVRFKEIGICTFPLDSMCN